MSRARSAAAAWPGDCAKLAPSGDALKIRLLCGWVLLAAVPALAPYPAAAQGSADSVERIEIRAQSIAAFDPREPARTRFGALAFRGGLVLDSPHRHFGGLSSLRVAADGRNFLALSDKGYWLRGQIVYRDGRPIAIEQAEMAPLLGRDRRPLHRRGWYDSEALAEDGGTLYVAIERVTEIVRFDYAREGLRARGHPIAVPSAIKRLPYNKSIECLVMAPKGTPLAGTLIAISERGLDAQGNLLGFLIGGRRGGSFALKRTDEFDVSDCALTPRGNLLVLERRFSWLQGLAMRIRSIALATIKPGALVDGPELIVADLAQQIDNMEGLSVHRAADGALVLTLISDDNYSALQRTLLLQFALQGE
jgi:hypothetical protein